MRITIDTNTDSKEEISKAIALLQSLVGEKPVHTTVPKNIFVSEEPVPTNVFSLFDNKKEETPKEKENQPIDFY